MQAIPTAFAPAVLLALAAAGQDTEQAPDVPVRLVASLATVAPECEFDLGVHVPVPAGWHVYWENPGDTGMPTSAQLEAPPGFQVEGPLFPGPTRHTDPSGLVSFTHEGDLVLFFRVRAPAELPEGPLQFAARVRWLMCKQLCFVGSAEPELELETGSEPASSAPATRRLLDAQRALLPRPFDQLGDDVHVEWLAVTVAEGERERFTFRLELPQADGLDFFPSPAAPLELVRQSRESSGSWSRLAVELARRQGAEPQPARIRGVLRLEKQGKVTFFGLDLTRQPAAERDR
jgi:thiol:disulfide interchange protein DsbD